MTEQQPYPQNVGPTQKKRRMWPWIVGAVAALIIGGAIASGNGGNDAGTAGGVPAGNEANQAVPAEQESTERTVVYRVTGTGSAMSITYVTDGMTTMNQESDVALPWEKTVTLPAGEAMQMVSLTAQGGGSGKIHVTIEVDGEVIKEAQADGYGVAMANENIGTLG